MKLQDQLFKEIKEKKIFDLARSYAYNYADDIEQMRTFPSQENLDKMNIFDGPLDENGTSAETVLQQLHEYGGPATIAQTGGRYFGFVNGGALPISIATKWLSDFWDQCAGLYLTSPINAKLEAVCENWLKDIFGLPDETVAGFVSGTSTANLCALGAARYRLLKNLDWDVNQKGFNGSPRLRIIAHKHIHMSIKKALFILGFGEENVEWFEADAQGRLSLDHLPKLDNRCIVLTQAGNVNSGAYDPFVEVCKLAKAAGAWVHVDGAFGLWAQASQSLKHLTNGIELADSWSLDGHKTLNTPYDSGIVLCKDSEALISAFHAAGAYIKYSEHRDPIYYTNEMSKRARAIELWSVMKYLGKSGIDELVTGLHLKSKQLAQGLEANGFRILNEVVFNQTIVACETPELTEATLANIQASGKCWCSGSLWHDESVIRMSVCSWATTSEDIEETVRVFVNARDLVLSV